MLPYMKYSRARTKRQTVRFLGINYGQNYAEGELEESENLSTRKFPCMSQRPGRTEIEGYDAPDAIFAHGGLIVADGGKLYVKGEYAGDLTPGAKQIAAINTKIVIFPDKVYYDENEKKLLPLGAKYECAAGTAVFGAGTLTVEGADFGADFKAGDAVEISGCTQNPQNNGSHIVREIEGGVMTFNPDIFTEGTEPETVTLERKVPDLNCICESDNRIWGAEGSTIYASALGDPRNFGVYDGVSTDSYAVAVGTDGEFTGCCAYSSTVLFWKEDCLHRILGSYPAEYQMYTYTVPGLQKGCAGSMQIINETLYYKGRAGIYAYTGGTPELISACFGERRYTEAAAGNDGERYYISMKDQDSGAWGLYAYDTRRGIWLREDGTRASGFACLDGYLYCIDADKKKILKFGDSGGDAKTLEWSATFHRFDEGTHGRKGYPRLYLRVELGAQSWFKAEISADGAPYRQIFAGHNERARTLILPLPPTRCDFIKLRLSGKGECVIKSIVREFQTGSEI